MGSFVNDYVRVRKEKKPVVADLGEVFTKRSPINYRLLFSVPLIECAWRFLTSKINNLTSILNQQNASVYCSIDSRFSFGEESSPCLSGGRSLCMRKSMHGKIYAWESLCYITVSPVFLFPKHRGGGAVGWSVRPASGKLDVRNSAATELSRKKQVVTAPLLNARQ